MKDSFPSAKRVGTWPHSLFQDQPPPGHLTSSHPCHPTAGRRRGQGPPPAQGLSRHHWPLSDLLLLKHHFWSRLFKPYNYTTLFDFLKGHHNTQAFPPCSSPLKHIFTLTSPQLKDIMFCPFHSPYFHQTHKQTLPGAGPGLCSAPRQLQWCGFTARCIHPSKKRGADLASPGAWEAVAGLDKKRGKGTRWQSGLGFVPASRERRSGGSSRQLASPCGYRSRAALPIFFLYLPARRAGCFGLHVIRQQMGNQTVPSSRF